MMSLMHSSTRSCEPGLARPESRSHLVALAVHLGLEVNVDELVLLCGPFAVGVAAAGKEFPRAEVGASAAGPPST